MLEPSLPEIEATVLRWAEAEPLVRRVYLFGSRARADYRPDSDIDLAVVYRLDPQLLSESLGDRNTAHFWMCEHRSSWRQAFAGIFGVPVHLELFVHTDKLLHCALKRSRVLLYQQGCLWS